MFADNHLFRLSVIYSSSVNNATSENLSIFDMRDPLLQDLTLTVPDGPDTAIQQHPPHSCSSPGPSAQPVVATE